MRPFEAFLEQALEAFEREVPAAPFDDPARQTRLAGARDFALFLLGRPVETSDLYRPARLSACTVFRPRARAAGGATV